jgi:hypothetical protein
MAMEDCLRRWWGHRSFFAAQKNLIRSVLRGVDVVASLGPGSGKSLAGHFAPVYLTHQTHAPSFTVIVSSSEQALSLHCQSLRSLGLSVVSLTSSSSPRPGLLDDPTSSACLLFVTPEAFSASREYIAQRIAQASRLVSIVIEDAHLIMADRRLAALSQTREWFPTVPIVVLMDLAHPSLIAEATDTLRLQSPQLIRASLNRPHLFLSVKHSATPLVTLAEDLVEFYRAPSSLLNGTEFVPLKPSTLICVGAGGGAVAAIQSALSSRPELRQIDLRSGVHRAEATQLVQFNRDELDVLIVETDAAGLGGSAPLVWSALTSRRDSEAGCSPPLASRSPSLSRSLLSPLWSSWKRWTACHVSHPSGVFSAPTGAGGRAGVSPGRVLLKGTELQTLLSSPLLGDRTLCSFV